MNPHHSFVRFLAVALAALLIPTFAWGAEPSSSGPSTSYAFSGAVGYVAPGTVTAESVDLDTDSGYLVQGAADYYVAPRFGVGLYIQYQSVGIKDVSGTASVFGIGPTFKARFPVGERFTIRPSLSIGYQSGSWSEATKSTSGLGVGFQVEGAMPMANTTNGLVQLGFSTQPSGGNSDVDLTWAPIFYAAVGIEFAK
jgi:hypothetical protein